MTNYLEASKILFDVKLGIGQPFKTKHSFGITKLDEGWIWRNGGGMQKRQRDVIRSRIVANKIERTQQLKLQI